MEERVEPESRLPAEILQSGTLLGNEYAWRRTDLPRVFEAAEVAGLANLGGEVQFRALGGTCELYWHSFGASERQDGESAVSFIRRTRLEVEAALHRIPPDAELVVEGLAHFEFLRERAAEGVDVKETLCFVCYFGIPK